MIQEETGLYGFREWAGRVATTDRALSPSPTSHTNFPGSNTTTPYSTGLGECTSPTLPNLCGPSCLAPTLWRSPLTGASLSPCGRLSWRAVNDAWAAQGILETHMDRLIRVALGPGLIFPCTQPALSFHWRSTSPTKPTPCGPTLPSSRTAEESAGCSQPGPASLSFLEGS